MAIVVEEERNRVNLGRLLGWVVFLIVVGVAVYYIFFAAPELVTISPPAGVQAIEPITQFTLNPADVLNSATFTSLKPPSFPLPTPTGPATVGRSNPFIAP
jgi:hypothetical protein